MQEDCDPQLGSKNGSQCGHEDGIRMTMYYYGNEFNNSAGGNSGHWDYNCTPPRPLWPSVCLPALFILLALFTQLFI